MTAGYTDWGYEGTRGRCSWPAVLQPVLDFCKDYPPPARVLDVGCGNGYFIGQMLQRGYGCVGIDLSESGIAIARKTYPNARFEVLPGDDKVLENLAEPPFDLVVS